MKRTILNFTKKVRTLKTQWISLNIRKRMTKVQNDSKTMSQTSKTWSISQTLPTPKTYRSWGKSYRTDWAKTDSFKHITLSKTISNKSRPKNARNSTIHKTHKPTCSTEKCWDKNWDFWPRNNLIATSSFFTPSQLWKILKWWKTLILMRSKKFLQMKIFKMAKTITNESSACFNNSKSCELFKKIYFHIINTKTKKKIHLFIRIY